MTHAPRIAVVGSFMMDLVLQVERRPAPGETVEGSAFGMYLGGKGFNQALTAARLGANVAMIGAVGSDQFGDMFLAALEHEGIDNRFVRRHPDAGTGIGAPVIDTQGQNAIVIVPRANQMVTPADVQQARSAIAAADLLLVQLEVAADATLSAVQMARQMGKLVVVNPAPYKDIPQVRPLLSAADVVTPNESECHGLTGIMPTDLSSAGESSAALVALGAGAAVITLGAQGAHFCTRHDAGSVPAYPVTVVDTTGAGDAFNGALAVGLAAGLPLSRAVYYANAAGALAVTRLGAAPAMPGRAELTEFLTRAGGDRYGWLGGSVHGR
jgi:ribokinase